MYVINNKVIILDFHLDFFFSFQIKLDVKTEQLHKLESKYSNERDRVINLSTEVASARQQLEYRKQKSFLIS